MTKNYVIRSIVAGAYACRRVGNRTAGRHYDNPNDAIAVRDWLNERDAGYPARLSLMPPAGPYRAA